MAKLVLMHRNAHASPGRWRLRPKGCNPAAPSARSRKLAQHGRNMICTLTFMKQLRQTLPSLLGTCEPGGPKGRPVHLVGPGRPKGGLGTCGPAPRPAVAPPGWPLPPRRRGTCEASAARARRAQRACRPPPVVLHKSTGLPNGMLSGMLNGMLSGTQVPMDCATMSESGEVSLFVFEL